jgi:ABC-type antimicrobial peptide transport system permease subunit
MKKLNRFYRVSRLIRKAKRFVSTQLAIVVGFLTLAVTDLYAADSGTGAIDSAATTIKSYQTPVQNLMYAIAAVIAIVGAFNVYFKMQNGDQDVKKTIMLVIGGCVAFVAMATALPAFFK